MVMRINIMHVLAGMLSGIIHGSDGYKKLECLNDEYESR